MSEYKPYIRKGVSEMRPYVPGEDLTGVSISDAVKANGSPKAGDMIARNPKNHEDKWLVSEKYFSENLIPAEEVGMPAQKTLGNTTASGARQNVKDIVFLGDGDTFKLISKASSQNEGWMKSTKAMQTGSGCVVQVTTQQRNPDGSYSLAEALAFVPDGFIQEVTDDEGKVVSRHVTTPDKAKYNGVDLAYALRDLKPGRKAYEQNVIDEAIAKLK
jgi:hypothetical protein